jgi:1-acyl-sn-glycerol-3-phosphate acyltransferase
MTLYSILKQLLKFATRMYFVEVSSVDEDKVPKSGPVILAANHPSSILDSVILATELPRPVHYLAKSELFKSRALAALYRGVGAIPIERGQQPEQHEQTFKHLYELFERGRCVGIFPEGRNSPNMQVAKLRTGTARIAFGAEERNAWQLGLTIVPVGLNFESRELFLSAVQLRYGDPIRVADYHNAYQEDPKAAIRALTDNMEQSLRELTLHLEDRRLSKLVNDLGTVYNEEVAIRDEQPQQPPRPLQRSQNRLGQLLQKGLSWFRPQLLEPVDLSGNLRGRQQISHTLSRAAQEQPESVDDLRKRVERYQAHLGQSYLRADLRQNFEQPLKERLIRLRMTLYAIVMAPLAAFGLVHNAIPYLFSRWLGQRFDDEAVRGFTYFGVGVLAFAFTYSVYFLWLWQFTGRSLTSSLGYLALLPPTGFVTLRYRGRIMQYRNKILVRTFFRTQENMAELLRAERSEIIERLQHLHQRFGAKP